MWGLQGEDKGDPLTSDFGQNMGGDVVYPVSQCLSLDIFG